MYEFTKTPIIIAIYQRDGITDCAKEDTLRMIDISHLDKVVKDLNLPKILKKNKLTNEEYNIYRIPIKHTMERFTLIDHLIKKLEK